MKNISSYEAEKYKNSKHYTPVGDGVYIYDNPPDVTYNALQRALKLGGSQGRKYKYGLMLTDQLEPKLYVTSLSFELEPELGEEGSPSNVPQYPLEALLDKYLVHVSDFYEELNKNSEKLCYREFASMLPNGVQELRQGVIGKHVYTKDNNLVIE